MRLSRATDTPSLSAIAEAITTRPSAARLALRAAGAAGKLDAVVAQACPEARGAVLTEVAVGSQTKRALTLVGTYEAVVRGTPITLKASASYSASALKGVAAALEQGVTGDMITQGVVGALATVEQAAAELARASA